MSALYWPDFDCTPASRAIEHASVSHEHFAVETEACLAFLGYIGQCQHQIDTLGGTTSNMKYRCIRGPEGLLRGVRV